MIKEFKQQGIPEIEEKYLTEGEIRAIIDESLTNLAGTTRVVAGEFTNQAGTISVTPTGSSITELDAGSLINIQGWTFSGTFSASDANTVAWTSGTITLGDGTTFSISAGNTGNIAALTYIYFDKGTSETVLQKTTTSGTAAGANKILLCVAKNETGKDATFQAFGAKGTGVLITADNIAANTVTANEIAGNTITASEIAAGAVNTSELHADSVTATEISIGTLSAISANMGTITAGSMAAERITSGTFIGRTFKANNGAGADVWVENDGIIRFRYGSNTKALIYANSNGDIVIDADNTLHLFADGAGDDIVIAAADIILMEATNFYFESFHDTQHECDNWIVKYNNDNDGADCYWYSNSSLKMKLTSAGNLEIAGTLSKGGGSFRIDHPLKPKTHILNHSFTESPEQLNIYKGRAKTKNKKAIIKLPNYFEALNEKIEYQLTPIKSLARLGIKKEVKNNKFEVFSDEDCEFSWTVMGVRKDRFAKANPIIVEEKKEKEGYLHPELFGEKMIKVENSEKLKKKKSIFHKKRKDRTSIK